MFKLFKMMFTPEPGWVKSTTSGGVAAKATVTADPQDIIKGIGGYEGKDGWIEEQVNVQPTTGAAYAAPMSCKLTQVVFGAMKAGMTVNVKCDPKNPQHVLLVDDVHALLHSRVVK
jgi:hypothetical protein